MAGKADLFTLEARTALGLSGAFIGELALLFNVGDKVLFIMASPLCVSGFCAPIKGPS